MLNHEELLIDSAKKREPGAWQRLTTLYTDPLRRFVQSSIQDCNAAEDVNQEAWLGAFRSIERFDGSSSFQTWLFNIAHNKIVDHYRSRRYARRLIPLDDSALECSTEKENPAERAVSLEEIVVTIRNRVPAACVRAFTEQFQTNLQAGIQNNNEVYEALKPLAIRELAQEGIHKDDAEFEVCLKEKIAAFKERLRAARPNARHQEAKEILVNRRGFVIGVGASAASLAYGDFAFANTPRPGRRSRPAAFTDCRNVDDMADFVRDLVYSQAMGTSLRTAAGALDVRIRPRFFQMNNELILDRFWEEPYVVAKSATSRIAEHRGISLPDRSCLNRMEYECNLALELDRVDLLPSIEATANILSDARRWGIQRALILRSVYDPSWRAEYYDLNARYRETPVVPLDPYFGHLSYLQREWRPKWLGLVGGPVAAHQIETAKINGATWAQKEARDLLNLMVLRCEQLSDLPMRDAFLARIRKSAKC